MSTDYRTSSFCSGGDCVEISYDTNGNVRICATTDRTRGLDFTAEEWAAFVLGVKHGEFDQPDGG